MISFIIRRVIISIVVLIAISMTCFAVIQLPPGDFAQTYKFFLMNQAGLTEAEAEVSAQLLRARYGLDQPMPVQYLNWVKGMVTEGSFGFSFAYKRDVGELIAERLPPTILIAVLAHALSTFIGIGIGIYVAPRQYKMSDNVAAFVAFVLAAVPRFWIALVIIYVLVFVVGQQEVSGLFSPQYAVTEEWSLGKVWDLFKHIWPVIFIAGLGGVARNMRVMRGNLLDELNAQYVTTARSKGLREGKVMSKHAVPNALHPIIMYQGTVLPYMLQGELEAAIVLGIPTLGPMFYDSLLNQDIYIAGSFLLIYAFLLVLGNLIADICLVLLDPRVRYE